MSIQWNIERYDEVHSTQDVLKGLALKGAKEGVVVVADSQTSGRGRHGREWISLAGNLYFSILLKPDVKLQGVGQLGLVVGEAIGRALCGVVDKPEQISLKWPNDILAEGKKCAGILIETELNERNEIDCILVGVGVNTKEAPEIGVALNRNNEDVLNAVLSCLDQSYGAWCAGDFGKVLKSWHQMAYPQGTQMSVKLGDELIEGTFEEADLQGHLHLRLKDNSLRTITAGEIYVTGH